MSIYRNEKGQFCKNPNKSDNTKKEENVMKTINNNGNTFIVETGKEKTIIEFVDEAIKGGLGAIRPIVNGVKWGYALGYVGEEDKKKGIEFYTKAIQAAGGDESKAIHIISQYMSGGDGADEGTDEITVSINNNEMKVAMNTTSLKEWANGEGIKTGHIEVNGKQVGYDFAYASDEEKQNQLKLFADALIAAGGDVEKANYYLLNALNYALKGEEDEEEYEDEYEDGYEDEYEEEEDYWNEYHEDKEDRKLYNAKNEADDVFRRLLEKYIVSLDEFFR